MNYAAHSGIVNFIWGIADDVLRDIYVRGKYRDVILPMTVIRRLDALLEPGKQAVLAMQKQLDEAGVVNQHAALCQAAGEAFYNVSPFTLRDLTNRARQQQLKQFSNNPSFKKWLGDTIFGATYQEQSGQVAVGARYRR